MMKFSLSTSLLPEIRDLGDIAGLASAAGYDGIEWRIHDDYHLSPLQLVEQADHVRSICDVAGLAVPSLATYLAWTDHRNIEAVLRASQTLGNPIIRLAGFNFDGSRPYSAVLEEAQEQIARTVPLLRSAGITAVIETHFSTIHAGARAISTLLAPFDPQDVAVNLDAANIRLEGFEDWRITLELLGPSIRNVHARNLTWSRMGEGKWDWRWSALDDGLVDWFEVLGLLTKQGYSGYVANENIWGAPATATGYTGPDEVLTNRRGPVRPVSDRLADVSYLRRAAAG